MRLTTIANASSARSCSDYVVEVLVPTQARQIQAGTFSLMASKPVARTMDYRSAAQACRKNAIGHAHVAYLLRANAGKSVDEVLGYAVSHACLAFEESCKAAWCALIARKLFSRRMFKTEVYRWHQAKTFLFVALTTGGVIHKPQDNVLQVSGQDLTEERLKKVKRGSVKATTVFEKDKQAGLYVDFGNGRPSLPSDYSIEDAEGLVYRYVHRMAAMLAVTDLLLATKPEEYVSGIAVTEADGTWNITRL